jgi:hypothetical protein
LQSQGAKLLEFFSDGSPLSAQSWLLDFVADTASVRPDRCMAMTFRRSSETCANETSLCHLH